MSYKIKYNYKQKSNIDTIFNRFYSRDRNCSAQKFQWTVDGRTS